MNSAIVFLCIVAGNVMVGVADETCSAGQDSCAPSEDEVNLMQVNAQVHKFNSGKTRKYGPYTTRPALEYFKHWSRGKVDNHVNNQIRTKVLDPTDLALMANSWAEQEPEESGARVAKFIQMHRERQCAETAAMYEVDNDLHSEKYSLHDSSIDANGVAHFVLHSSKGSLQYVAQHLNRVVSSYPELCPYGAFIQHPKPKADKPEKGGGPKNLDAKSDKMVKDCVELFHRTAKENCKGEDFKDVEVLNAVEKVIDGLAVELQVKVDGKMHDITCDFEVPGSGEDAKLLQASRGLPTKTGPADGKGPGLKDLLPEEKKLGLQATLVMDIDICDADAKSSMSMADIKFFEMRKHHPSGELSRYKGFEHVNDDLPKITEEVLMQFGENVPDAYDLRTAFPGCYPDSYKEPVRDQGGCGSCWAFASASATMNNLCGSANGNPQSMADATDRFEVSVQQIMSCNSDKNGCEGGFASSADDSMRTKGITRERTSPYACGSGNALNHFDDAPPCPAFPWGGSCNGQLADAGWNWGGASEISGEAGMKAIISQGFALYGSFDVYPNFMSGTYSIYTECGCASAEEKKGGHAVTLVAYGVDGGTKYWTMQNSWGSDWAVNGYARFLRGTNLAGIEEGAYYMRAWVSEASKAPPCFDSSTSGLNSGGEKLSCAKIKEWGFCTSPSWKEKMSRACPKSCGTCPGGKSGPQTPSPAATNPAPAPSPPPGPPPPGPAPTACYDSETFKDPNFGDSCADWNGFKCDGYGMSDILKKYCPLACKTCVPTTTLPPMPTSCVDSTAYEAPFNPGKKATSCESWKGYACNMADKPGLTSALLSMCPAACKTCVPGGPLGCEDSPSYSDPQFGDTCPQWKGFTCGGYGFSDDLMKACPVACKQCIPGGTTR